MAQEQEVDCSDLFDKASNDLKTLDKELDTLEDKKEDIIKKLAKDVEERGVQKNKIARIVVKALVDRKAASPSYIYESLGIEKKQKEKSHTKDIEESATVTEQTVTEQTSSPEEIAITNTGQEAVPEEEAAYWKEQYNMAEKKVKQLEQVPPDTESLQEKLKEAKDRLEEKENLIEKLRTEQAPKDEVIRDLKTNDTMKREFALTLVKYTNIIQDRIDKDGNDDGEGTFNFYVVSKNGYYIPIAFYFNCKKRKVKLTLDEKRLD